MTVLMLLCVKEFPLHINGLELSDTQILVESLLKIKSKVTMAHVIDAVIQ